jgi:16S rRNA (uracil1498-N3)-methyltransferase
MGEDSAYDMARRRFFVSEVSRGRAELRGDDARHLTRVLRVEAGQRYEISDNRNVYLAEVAAARKDFVDFRILEKVEESASVVSIALLVSLVKFDRFEWILEKATELDVAMIVPVEAERSERGLEKAVAKRIERWRRILLESSQQARRAVLPELLEPLPFEKAIQRQSAHRFLLDERADATPLLDSVLEQRSGPDEVALLTGPEGGWTDHERDRAAVAGWAPVSLGPRILRAETAVIGALAVVNAAWQRRNRIESTNK